MPTYTINDAIRKAWATADITAICHVVDALRFTCGFTYEDTLIKFQDALPDVDLTPARFDSILYARDEGYTGTLAEIRNGWAR